VRCTRLIPFLLVLLLLLQLPAAAQEDGEPTARTPTDIVHDHGPDPQGQETWPSFNESGGCGLLSAPSPSAGKIGTLADSEKVGGPYGDFFGRSIGDVRDHLVDWIVPMSGGYTVKVHERALPAFELVAANIAAEQAKGKNYTINPTYTASFVARTVSGVYGISRHSYGSTIDINWHTNPFRSDETLITDMPDWFVNAWKDAGFCWGGDWIDFKDPMHFSWQGPSQTPGYGAPPGDMPVTTGLVPFTEQISSETTLFAGRAGIHLVANVTGRGAGDELFLDEDLGGVLIRFTTQSSQFQECSGGRGFADGHSIDEPLIVGDLSGMQRTDVGFVDESGPKLTIDLYRLIEGWLEEESIETGISPTAGSHYLVADYNWDGTPDIYVVRPGTTIDIYDGTDFTTLLTSVSALGDTDGWKFTVGDFDLDDRPDVYALEPGGAGATLHVVANDGTVTTVATGIDLQATSSVAALEFDGDGRDDIWVNTEGVMATWRGSDGPQDRGWARPPDWECPDEWDPIDYTGLFHDDDNSIFEADIEWLGEAEITLGCNPPDNDEFCPSESVTRAQMAAFLVRALDLPDGPDAGFTDDDGTIFENDINALATAGITFGCSATEFCPWAPVTRAQMAAFVGRALNLPPGPDGGFADDAGSQFEGDINALAAAGITFGCAPDLFCPGDEVTRGQMAAFLKRGLTGPFGPGA